MAGEQRAGTASAHQDEARSPAGLPDACRCLVMGVVNVTPDSFSDGGDWFEADAAIAHGLDLVAQGADIVDVGGEPPAPARPGSTLRRNCAGSGRSSPRWPPRA